MNDKNKATEKRIISLAKGTSKKFFDMKDRMENTFPFEIKLTNSQFIEILLGDFVIEENGKYE
mgnify:FL=1